MATINQEILKDALGRYKEYFTAQWDDESYKWEAVKWFKHRWNPDADNFAEMWMSATEKCGNLLVSQHSFPRRMIEEFAKVDPENTKAMFHYLYDESIALESRITNFIKASDTLKNKYGKNPDGSVKWNNHFQNLNCISTYLWLMYPDKYYIYKVTEMRKAANVLESDFVPKNGQDAKMLIEGYAFFDTLRKSLKADPSLRELLDSRLSDDCYPDPEMVTLTIDFDFYLSRYYDYDLTRGVRCWLYQPGEGARLWDEFYDNGIMGLGWDELGNLSQYSSPVGIKDKMDVVYGTKTNHMNDKCATWDFANRLQEGDIIYVKGRRKQLLGRGIVESEYIYDDSRSEYRNIRNVRWTNKGDWQYKNSFPVKSLTDITYYQDMINELNTLIDGKPSVFEPSGYWWLCASPSIWHFSDISVGDECNYTRTNEKGNKRKIVRNFDAAKVGDLIIGYEAYPVKQVVALCRISKVDEDNVYFTKTDDLPNPISFDELKAIPELQNMEFFKHSTGSLFFLTKTEYDKIIEVINTKNSSVHEGNTAETIENYGKEDFLKDVFMTEEECDELVEILKRKKNLILEGAPGVGKTFAAKRLAYLMMGCKDSSRIGTIQFHQNYSYENFIEGYKPDENSFHIEKGIFYNFCDKAKDDPDNDYFFIIDEINRGNLSKIFGELLALIEDKYRGLEHSLPLSYSKKPFFVPNNVYIIGMMNTADRSLAIIDYALRRRFSFFMMSPAFDSEGFQKMRTSISNDKYDKLVIAVKTLNEIIEKDPSLGDGFKIGHSYFCVEPEKVTDKWISTVAKYEIIPLVREYWFDNVDKVKEESDKILEAIK